MSTSTPSSVSSDRAAVVGFTPNAIDWVALLLMIVGALNWGLVGAFNFNLVSAIFGEMTMASRAVYILVGLAGLYGLTFLARFGRRV